MATTINPESKELVESLIRKEFEQVDFSLEYIYGKADKLIKTANDLGLSDLANELSNDLKQVA